MVLREEGISIIGMFGLVELTFSHIRELWENSTASLELKLCLSGKLFFKG